ncbi:MAG: HDIG domain-containing metalloprotein [Bacteroidota bacterium]
MSDALLVKTAALYHDIGKTTRPEYFIENQSGSNPHQQLDELESAKIIISHVIEGIRMAKKEGLPRPIIDFIRSHHGNSRTEFFYLKYQEKNPDKDVNPSLFQYPGPNPVSKEETILMLADSTEAACKSLDKPTEEELSNLIDRVFAGKLTSGLLDNSHLSFRELQTCRTVFRNILKSVHHVRIPYPDKKE